MEPYLWDWIGGNEKSAAEKFSAADFLYLPPWQGASYNIFKWNRISLCKIEPSKAQNFLKEDIVMQTGMTYEDFLHYAEETQDLGGATVVRKISRNWFNEEVRRSGPIDRKAAREILWILRIDSRWRAWRQSNTDKGLNSFPENSSP